MGEGVRLCVGEGVRVCGRGCECFGEGVSVSEGVRVWWVCECGRKSEQGCDCERGSECE